MRVTHSFWGERVSGLVPAKNPSAICKTRDKIMQKSLDKTPAKGYIISNLIRQKSDDGKK
jgi:hypothetical protein